MPDTSTKAIGKRLGAVREVRGWAQSYAAQIVGLSPQRWGNYERGLNVPPPDVLAKWWQLTGATSDYTLFGRMDGLPLDLAQALLDAEKEVASPEAKTG